MSNGSAPRPLRTSSKQPRADFHWPPTEDGTEYRENAAELEVLGVQADQPPSGHFPDVTDALDLFPSETPRAPVLAGVGQPLSTPADSRQPDPFPTGRASAPQPSPAEDSAQAHSDGEDLEHFRPEARSTSGIAVSPGAAARDVPDSPNLADEITHLQTLIEGLTQKIEWRIPPSPDLDGPPVVR